MSKKTPNNNRMWPFSGLFSKDGKGEPNQGQEKKSETQEKKNRRTPATNIQQARQVISEIEAIIQKELSLMSEDNFNSNENGGTLAKHPKKRPAPKLIRPLNKKKNKIVYAGMEFDPVKNVWLGNDKDLAVFLSTPALIQPINKSIKTQKFGEMEFDSENQVWRGNERDLKKFNQPSFLGPDSVSTELVEQHQGMVFDSEEMRWKGNEEELDVFGDIEKAEDERGFTVGKEFSLSSDVINSFKRCEEEHNSSLQGWCSAKEVDPKKHLNAIRGMSIIRIINQAKSSSLPSLVVPTGNLASVSSFPSSPSKRNFEDDDEEEIKGAVGFVKKFSSEKKTASKKPSTSLPSSVLNKYSEENEDWEEEFEADKLKANLSNSALLTSPSDLVEDANKLCLSSDDEDSERNDEWDGLEVPSNSFFLKKPLSLSHPLTSAPKSMLLKPAIVDDSNPNETEDWGIPDSLAPVLTPEKREVVEETWSDVEFPSHPISFRNLNPSSGRQVVAEDLTDLVFPQNGELVLSTRHRAQSFDEGEGEEEWSDVVVPDNFSGRLKK